jgi:hypothetical protein
MSEEARADIEAVIRQLQEERGEEAVVIDGGGGGRLVADGHALVEGLLQLGFAEQFVMAAVAAVGAVGSGAAVQRSTAQQHTAALDWLCMNVPEELLPARFNPDGESAEAMRIQPTFVNSPMYVTASPLIALHRLSSPSLLIASHRLSSPLLTTQVSRSRPFPAPVVVVLVGIC